MSGILSMHVHLQKIYVKVIGSRSTSQEQKSMSVCPVRSVGLSSTKWQSCFAVILGEQPSSVVFIIRLSLCAFNGLCSKFTVQRSAPATAINTECINQHVRRRQFPVPVALGRQEVSVVDSRLTCDAAAGPYVDAHSHASEHVAPPRATTSAIVQN